LSRTTVLDGLPESAAPPAEHELAELPEITDADAQRLLAILLHGTDSAPAWQRARILALAAQRMSPAEIGQVVGADPIRVRGVIDDFVRDGFASVSPPCGDPHATG
jgi:hypothetical protein